jgi:hypothetical protein
MEHMRSLGIRPGGKVVYGNEIYVLKSVSYGASDAKASISHATKKDVKLVVPAEMLSAPVVDAAESAEKATVRVKRKPKIKLKKG